LRRYEHLHPVQCVTLIAPYVLWSFFDGNYQEYEADKRKRLGEEGAKQNSQWGQHRNSL